MSPKPEIEQDLTFTNTFVCSKCDTKLKVSRDQMEKHDYGYVAGFSVKWQVEPHTCPVEDEE